MGGSLSEINVSGKLIIGEEMSKITGKFVRGENNAEIAMNVSSPYLESETASIEASVSINAESDSELAIQAVFNDRQHSFVAHLFSELFKITAVAQSSYIPTGQVSAKGQASYDAESKAVKIEMDFATAAEEASIQLVGMNPSDDEYTFSMESVVPFYSDEVLKAHGSYKLDGDHYVFFLYANDPIGFQIDVEFPNFAVGSDVLGAKLSVITPFDDFQKISGLVEFDTTSLTPKVEFDAVYNESMYDAHFSIRTDAPYELDMGANLPQLGEYNFHIMTDSSFFVFAY